MGWMDKRFDFFDRVILDYVLFEINVVVDNNGAVSFCDCTIAKMAAFKKSELRLEGIITFYFVER